MAVLHKLNPLNWTATERGLEWWDARAPRERLLLGFTALAVMLMAGWLGNRFMAASLQSTQQQRQTAEQKTVLARAVFDEWTTRKAKADAERAELAQYADFSPAGFLERTFNELELGDAVSSLNDRGVQEGEGFNLHTVDTRLARISLDRMVDLLYRIEAEKAPLRVTTIRAKTNIRDRNELSLTMTVAMLSLTSAPAAAPTAPAPPAANVTKEP